MTKEEIIEMAKKCGWDNPATNMMPLYEFAKLVAEKEREKCIYIAENYWNNCLSRAPKGTFLTSKKVSDRNYSEGIIQGVKELVTVLKSPDQKNISSTKIF